MAKTLPPKLGGQPPPPTGSTRERGVTSPAMPAAKPAAPPPDPKAQKKKLKDLDWSQKGFFDGDGLQGAEKVSQPPAQAPRRGRTLVIPAVPEQPQPEPQPQSQPQPQLQPQPQPPPGAARSAWAEAEAPSARDARETRDAQKPGAGEARGAASQRALGSAPMRRTEKVAMQPPPLPGEAKPKGTLYEMLENAKEPGVLFQEDDAGGGSGSEGEEEEDPELMEAVEECIRLLFGVRGIHHIGPGKNEQGEPVVVVSAGQGFNEESMRRVPERVGKFKTLVALPFDLLPLKRVAR